MKRLMVVFVMATFLVASFGQISYANDHYRHYKSEGEQQRYHRPPAQHYREPKVVHHYYNQPQHYRAPVRQQYQQPRRYNPPQRVVRHHNHRNGDAALAVLGGIVAIATLGAIMSPPRPQRNQYDYQRDAYRQYDDCINQGYRDCRQFLPR